MLLSSLKSLRHFSFFFFSKIGEGLVVDSSARLLIVQHFSCAKSLCFPRLLFNEILNPSLVYGGLLLLPLKD